MLTSECTRDQERICKSKLRARSEQPLGKQQVHGKQKTEHYCSLLHLRSILPLNAWYGTPHGQQDAAIPFIAKLAARYESITFEYKTQTHDMR